MNNHLHTLIDELAKGKVHVLQQLSGLKSAADSIKTFPLLARNAVCFYAELESVPEIHVSPELVRLPYPSIWVEFGSPDRVELIGLFCLQYNNQIMVLSFGRSSLGWTYSGMYMVYEKSGESFVETNQGMDFDDFPLFRTAITVLCQYLGALNCCNVKRKEHSPDVALQKARAKRGKQPLFSTWSLEIDLERDSQERNDLGGSHSSPRVHLRRGHIKKSRKGNWWWVNAHMVGNKSLGMIHKDYKTCEVSQ